MLRCNGLQAVLAFLMISVLCTGTADAEKLTLRKEVACKTGRLDNRYTCQVISMEQARNYLFKKLGTSLEQNSIALRNKLTGEKIRVLSTDLVTYDTLDEKFDGEIFVLDAVITINSRELLRFIIDLGNDLQKSKKLYAVDRMAKELIGEIKKVRDTAQMQNTSVSPQMYDDYADAITKLGAIHLYLRGSVSDGYDAVYAYSKAIDKNPQFMFAYFNRGMKYLELGNDDQALSDFNMAIQLDPDYIDTYYRRGMMYMDQGNQGKALDDFNRVLRSDTTNADVYYRRGVIHNQRGEYNNALKDFNRSLKLYPLSADTYCYRGIANNALGHTQQALDDFNAALKLDPLHAKAYYHRGLAFKARGNLHEAIIDFNKAIHHNPDYAEAYFARGDVYEHMGNFDLAFRDFDRAKELNLNSNRDGSRVTK